MEYPLLEGSDLTSNAVTVWEYWEDDVDNEQLQWLWNFLERLSIPQVSLGNLYMALRYTVTDNNEYIHRWIESWLKDESSRRTYEDILGGNGFDDKLEDCWIAPQHAHKKERWDASIRKEMLLCEATGRMNLSLNLS